MKKREYAFEIGDMVRHTNINRGIPDDAGSVGIILKRENMSSVEPRYITTCERTWTSESNLSFRKNFNPDHATNDIKFARLSERIDEISQEIYAMGGSISIGLCYKGNDGHVKTDIELAGEHDKLAYIAMAIDIRTKQ